jgi:AmiR/NasT family two-component response regulator
VILSDLDALSSKVEELCSAILGQRVYPIILLGTLPARETRSHDTLSACIHLCKPVQARILTEIINQVGTLSARNPNWLHILTSVHEILDMRLVIRDAAMYLAHRDCCSQAEAIERIHQEARAKRAKLADVAHAVLRKETIPYYYDVPI